MWAPEHTFKQARIVLIPFTKHIAFFFCAIEVLCFFSLILHSSVKHFATLLINFAIISCNFTWMELCDGN